MSNPIKLSDQLREAARNSGKTQTELAELAGTSQRAISDFLAGGGLALRSVDGLIVALKIKIKVPKKLQTEGI